MNKKTAKAAAPTLFHITPKSANEKTGALVVTTSARATCWDGCAFFLSGCYALGGPLGLHWAAVSKGERGQIWPDFLRDLAAALARNPAKIWRHNQAGDLPGDGARIDRTALLQLARVSRDSGRVGFTYTHKPLLPGQAPEAAANLRALREAARAGFVVNASANNPGHADALADLGLPVCVTVPEETAATSATPAGRKIIVCPAQQREGVTCATCGLCSKAKRSVIIGFRYHGAGKRKAEAAGSAFAL
jgi:hypothetical protein